MIEVNLLPGAKKSKRGGGGGGPSINFAALGAKIAANVKDKFLAAAVLIGALSFTAIALLFISQRNHEGQIIEARQKAVEDSGKYAALLLERARAQARRDSALLQLNVIKTIDEDRYIWPHILEEISRAMPPYTWLRTVALTGNQQGANPAAAIKSPPPDTGKVKKKRVEVVIPRDTVHVRLVGRTVDIQALTRFMRSLEDSPFLGFVSLTRSAIQIENGKEVTQFELEAMFTRPDTTLLRRVPLTLTQR